MKTVVLNEKQLQAAVAMATAMRDAAADACPADLPDEIAAQALCSAIVGLVSALEENAPGFKRSVFESLRGPPLN